MTRRFDWEKANLAQKPKVSISDEQEFLDKGFTARWLEQAEKRAAERKRMKRKRSHTLKR